MGPAFAGVGKGERESPPSQSSPVKGEEVRGDPHPFGKLRTGQTFLRQGCREKRGGKTAHPRRSPP